MKRQQNNKTGRCLAVYALLASLFSITVFFSGCEKIQQVVGPKELETREAVSAIKIGFIYSPPDPGTTRNGAELAVALANEAGGINGIPIELLIRDDKRDATLSAQHAEALITAGVSAIVGPDYATQAVAVGPIVQQHGIPMVTTYPTLPRATEAGNFVFMTAFIDPYQASLMADFARQTLGAMTAAILTEADSTYSMGVSDVFAEKFTAQGGTIAVQQFYRDGATDFGEQLMAIAAVEPAVDVVFLPGLGRDFPLAVKQAKSVDIGIAATFLGADGWDRPDLVELGGMALEGSFFANHFSPGNTPDQLNEDARRFVTVYTAMFGIAPDGPAALGYDAVNIIVEAMRRATAATPAAIRDQIEATDGYSGATILSHFDENRHAIKSAVINTVTDGEIRLHQVIEP